MGGAEAAVKEALQFLNDGMRGFYCGLADSVTTTVAVGDTVFASRND